MRKNNAPWLTVSNFFLSSAYRGNVLAGRVCFFVSGFSKVTLQQPGGADDGKLQTAIRCQDTSVCQTQRVLDFTRWPGYCSPPKSSTWAAGR